MPQEDEVKTQVIAVLRIHAERAINKIKNFYIWDQVTPLSLFPILNQLWTQFVVFWVMSKIPFYHNNVSHIVVAKILEVALLNLKQLQG